MVDQNNNENLHDAVAMLAFIRHALTNAPIDLTQQHQHGLCVILEEIENKLKE